jgi:OmpA-OmpF porin, OOP family
VNQRLSKQRAETVRNHLIQNGQIEPARLQAVGYGSRYAAGSNETEEGKQTNRRVDFALF